MKKLLLFLTSIITQISFAQTGITWNNQPPVGSNPAWEKGLREGFARLVPDETILKLHLYSADWYVHRNALTSVPEYRQVGAWVATRRAMSAMRGEKSA